MATYETQKFTDAAEGLAWAWSMTLRSFRGNVDNSNVTAMFNYSTQGSSSTNSLVSQSKDLFEALNAFISMSYYNSTANVQSYMAQICAMFVGAGLAGLDFQLQPVQNMNVVTFRALVSAGQKQVVGILNLPDSMQSGNPPTAPVFVPIIQGYPIPFNITVKFNADGGSPTPANQTIAWQYDDFDIASEIEPVSTPSLTNHLFQGWYYNGLLVSTDGQTFSGIPSSQFSINDITITLNASWLASIAKGGYIIV